MENLNWLVMEMLAMQAHDQRAQAMVMPVATPPSRQDGRRGVKRSVASILVRLGLRLDPAAGEALGALDLSLARRQA